MHDIGVMELGPRHIAFTLFIVSFALAIPPINTLTYSGEHWSLVSLISGYTMRNT